MSIRGAVNELNSEIQRLTDIRDSLLQAETERATRSSAIVPSKSPAKTTGKGKKAAPAPVSSSTKSGAAKRSTSVKPKAAAKRVVSDATRKKMSEAAKARSAAKKTAQAK